VRPNYIASLLAKVEGLLCCKAVVELMQVIDFMVKHCATEFGHNRTLRKLRHDGGFS
jgi:hypothetical protein